MSDDATREEIIRRRVRYVLPARGDGLAIGDFQAAVRQAYADRDTRGLSNEYWDTLRIVAEDSEGGEVVLFFDVEEPASSPKSPSRLASCEHADDHAFTVRAPGTIEGLEKWHKLTVEVHCCGRPPCQARLRSQIESLTGVKTVVEPYPTQ